MNLQVTIYQEQVYIESAREREREREPETVLVGGTHLHVVIYQEQV